MSNWLHLEVGLTCLKLPTCLPASNFNSKFNFNQDLVARATGSEAEAIFGHSTYVNTEKQFAFIEFKVKHCDVKHY